MKKFIIFLFINLTFSILVFAAEPFRFALITDLHITVNNPVPAEDLQNAIGEINSMKDVDFVLVSGDITDNGDSLSLREAKKMLDKLRIPYYITAGNHETTWSESGFTDFVKIFGNNRFSFTHKGFEFIGFTTGPMLKMGDGHIAPQDIDWVKSELEKNGSKMPAFIITHYPLLNGDVDNWYDMTDVLRKFDIQAVLNGHYHRNAILNYDGIPGIVNRSTLRAKEPVGGYSIYAVSDSLRVYEKKIGHEQRLWLTLPLESKNYGQPDASLRPSYDINVTNKNVSEIWRVETRKAIYGTPTYYQNNVYYGDDSGFMNAISASTGKSIWDFKTGSRIFSSPIVSKGKLVFGSTDDDIYCLNAKDGKLIWKITTARAVMGDPLIQNDTFFIGGSDGCFRAIDLNSGKILWKFCSLKGYMKSKPFIAENKVYFGAWDTYFYALNVKDGSLVWKWNNGNAGMHYSPAAVYPVYSYGKIFITAPDRFWTALDAQTGKVVWRTNRHEVRETEGISTDGNVIFSRCMNDSVVALDAKANFPKQIWKTSAGYGYDHNPSMLIERNGVIIFGTKNGLLHGIDAKTGAVLWRHKIGNSIINTVNIISNTECILTTSEGSVVRLKY